MRTLKVRLAPWPSLWPPPGSQREATIRSALFEAVLTHTPLAATHAGIEEAVALRLETDVSTAARVLGNGTQVISEDTVPFTLWCTARHLRDFEEAMWSTVSGLGDRDTTCAIVGGILALHGEAKIPEEWLANREPLERMSRKLLGARGESR